MNYCDDIQSKITTQFPRVHLKCYHEFNYVTLPAHDLYLCSKCFYDHDKCILHSGAPFSLAYVSNFGKHQVLFIFLNNVTQHMLIP